MADTGPGTPPEVLPKPFESYFPTKPPTEETGFGLAIGQPCTKENDGAPHAPTEVGTGTTFAVFLSARARLKNEQPG